VTKRKGRRIRWVSIYLSGIPWRRIRMPSPLPLVDTHPLGEDWLFSAANHHPRRLHRRACRRSLLSRGYHVARDHVERFYAVRRCRPGRRARARQMARIHPLSSGVNDPRAESRLGVA